MDIKKLAKMSEFNLELKSLGRVRCMSLTTTHLSQANEKLRSSDVGSHDLVRWSLGKMARRHVEGHVNEDDEGSSLTPEELSSVTNEELEDFAEKLIQKNRYLLKTHKGSDLERLADETACDFLVRVFRHYAAEQKAQCGRMTESMSKSLSCSAALGAVQRNLVQQSALGAIAEANRYLTENSASVASAMHFKHVLQVPCWQRPSTTMRICSGRRLGGCPRDIACLLLLQPR